MGKHCQGHRKSELNRTYCEFRNLSLPGFRSPPHSVIKNPYWVVASVDEALMYTEVTGDLVVNSTRESGQDSLTGMTEELIRIVSSGGCGKALFSAEWRGATG